MTGTGLSAPWRTLLGERADAVDVGEGVVAHENTKSTRMVATRTSKAAPRRRAHTTTSPASRACECREIDPPRIGMRGQQLAEPTKIASTLCSNAMRRFPPRFGSRCLCCPRHPIALPEAAAVSAIGRSGQRTSQTMKRENLHPGDAAWRWPG